MLYILLVVVECVVYMRICQQSMNMPPPNLMSVNNINMNPGGQPPVIEPLVPGLPMVSVTLFPLRFASPCVFTTKIFVTNKFAPRSTKFALLV